MHEFLPSEYQLLDEIEGLKAYRLAVKGRSAALASLGASPVPGRDLSEDLVDSVIAKKEQMLRKYRELHEVNAMLGHRGVRVAITYPEIYEMQIRAVLEAMAACMKDGVHVALEIMVPQVITAQELKRVKLSVDKVRQEIETRFGFELPFKFGTMVETVRACMRSRELAKIVHFFSFGTNDLTQAVFSFSREDAENKFLPLYTEYGILRDNPFDVLDVKGVGVLMQMTVDWGRESNPDLKIGICGEQVGQEPDRVRPDAKAMELRVINVAFFSSSTAWASRASRQRVTRPDRSRYFGCGLQSLMAVVSVPPGQKGHRKQDSLCRGM